jgi:hypothetical protein
MNVTVSGYLRRLARQEARALRAPIRVRGYIPQCAPLDTGSTT